MSLNVSSLCGGYRKDVVVFADVDLDLDRATVGCIGRNGAGKSCLALTLAGFLAPTGGRIVLDGVDLSRLRSRARVRAGVCLVPEGRLVFGQLTVRENLLVAAHAAGVRSRSNAAARLEETFPILGAKRGKLAASLSGGEQQLLAIARALIQEPRVLILDEPSLGLSPIAIDRLCDALRGVVAESNLRMILMEQNAELLTRLCDDVYLIDQGRLSRSLDMSVPADREHLRTSYLGM